MSFPYSWWTDEDLKMHRRTLELALSLYPSGQDYWAMAVLRSQLDDVEREFERRRTPDSVKTPPA